MAFFHVSIIIWMVVCIITTSQFVLKKECRHQNKQLYGQITFIQIATQRIEQHFKKVMIMMLRPLFQTCQKSLLIEALLLMSGNGEMGDIVNFFQMRYVLIPQSFTRIQKIVNNGYHFVNKYFSAPIAFAKKVNYS